MHLTLRRGCAQLPHIRTPFFVSNSQFDSWSMGSILGAQAYISLCPADQKSYGTCSTNCKLPYNASLYIRASGNTSHEAWATQLLYALVCSRTRYLDLALEIYS